MSLCLIIQLLGRKHRKWNNAWSNKPAEWMPRILAKTMTNRRCKTSQWESEEELCSPGIWLGGSQPLRWGKALSPDTDSWPFHSGHRGAEVILWDVWQRAAKMCSCGSAGASVRGPVPWGQHSHKQPGATGLPQGLWIHMTESGFLLCLLLTKGSSGETDFICILKKKRTNSEVRLFQATHRKQGKDVVCHSTGDILWGPSCGQRKFILCQCKKKVFPEIYSIPEDTVS